MFYLLFEVSIADSFGLMVQSIIKKGSFGRMSNLISVKISMCYFCSSLEIQLKLPANNMYQIFQWVFPGGSSSKVVLR